MHTTHSTKIAYAIALALFSLAPRADATEGGLGRPITGLQATSYAGLIPPTPGFSTMVGYIHYDGEISASREVPVAGVASLGLNAQLDMFTFTGLYIWDTAPGRWNYASMATVAHSGVDASAVVGLGPAAVTRRDSSSGVYDLLFAPVIASYHISETRHVSLALNLYAPIGKYEVGRLANPGLNVWTYSPTVGYTQLMQQGSLEFSAVGAVDIYQRNSDTAYKSGAVLRADALLVKRYGNGFGLGLAAGAVYQLQDDEGDLADRLGGFKGRSLALGPVINYQKRWEGGQMELSLRWLGEFAVENRFRGQPLMLSSSMSF